MTERIASEFGPAKESVSWAEDAANELLRECSTFFNGRVTEVVTEFDAETGENVQKVRLVEPIPPVLKRRVTEGLTHARHAFDQAAFAARNLISGHSRKSVYYPWATSPADLEQRLGNFDERLRDTFRAHEPYPRGEGYPGGEDVIRTLATMANDKHTVGLVPGVIVNSYVQPSFRVINVQSFRMLAPKWDPVKNEAELARWIGEVEVDGQYHFQFQVLFKEPRLTQPVDVVTGVRGFAAKAKAVVEDLQARCAELGA